MAKGFARLAKRASVLAAMTLLATTSSFLPAEAAIKAGDPCKKEGATMKIGGDRYTCTKNPRYPKDKRSWVWNGCLQSHALYIDSVKRLETLKVGLVSAKAKLDQLISEIPIAEAQAKEYDKKVLDTQVKLEAAKASYSENLAKGAAFSKATEQWANAVRSYERAITAFKRAAEQLRKKNTDVIAQQKRLEVQGKTIAASEFEIKANLQGRNQACQRGL